MTRVSPTAQREMLRRMILIRAFEEKATERFNAALKQGQFLGALHTYHGEEAIAVGACFDLRVDDYVVSTHRGHGHCLAKGADPGPMLAELAGRATGLSGGYGGSMHLFDLTHGLLGGNGIVGGGLPLAAGAGFSVQYRGTDQVALCFFGDGASKQGVFHESFDLAALWHLPVIYICEANQYAATTRCCETSPVPDFADMAQGYGCPGVVVDGNDVLAVHEVAGQAITRARAGEGPTLIEAKTYRMKPHCMVIRETRAACELTEWEQRDPIASFEQRLLEAGLIEAEELARLREDVQSIMEAASRFADEGPWPEVATVADVLWA